MDKRIFITLIAVILLIGAFIGIRMMLNDKCEIPEITIEPAYPEVGQIVKFSCGNTEDNITWDFDDGKSSSGTTAEHIFDSAGTYNVVARVNDNCQNTKEVIIRSPRKVETIQPVINIPAEIRAGEVARFSETTSGAAVRKWTVKETSETGEGENFSTTFKTPGTYHLGITLSGNYIAGDSVYAIEVLKPVPAKPVVREPVPVVPRPAPKPAPKPEPKPQPAASTFMSDADFTSKFVEVVGGLTPGNRDIGPASDDWRDIILKQGCAGQSLQIIEDKTIYSDELFKQKVINGEITKVTVLKILRNTNKCITKIIISAR